MTGAQLEELESRLRATAILGAEANASAKSGRADQVFFKLGHVAASLGEINGLLASMLPSSRPESVPVHPQQGKETA